LSEAGHPAEAVIEAKERVNDSLTEVEDLLTGSDAPTVHRSVTNQRVINLLRHLTAHNVGLYDPLQPDRGA
jgi:hypothetical protein